MARLFNKAIEDNVELAIGGSSGTAWGPFSLALVCRVNLEGTVRVLLTAETSAPGLAGYLYLTSGNVMELELSDVALSTVSVPASDGWVLVGVTKATGQAIPRFHKYVFSTRVWTHGAGNNSINNSSTPGAGGHWRIGHPLYFGFDSGWSGDIDGVAFWTTSFTDAQFETLVGTYASWLNAGPQMMVTLDQSSTTMPVRDWVGSAHQTALGGTSVSTSSSPMGYGVPILVPSDATQTEPEIPSASLTFVAPGLFQGPFSLPQPWQGSYGESALVETNAAAETAETTAVAEDATPQVDPNAAAAEATGTSQPATANVQPNAENVAAAGTAEQPAPAVAPTGVAAEPTGVAQAAASSVAVNAACAEAGAAALDATVSAAQQTDAAAQAAEATAVAEQASAGVAPSAVAAEPVGVAQPVTPSVAVNAESVPVTASALDATISTATQTFANAQTAEATGTANNSTTAVAAAPTSAEATGAVQASTVGIGAATGAAESTGAAQNATIAIAKDVAAQAAEATGTAFTAAVAVAVLAEFAAAFAEAIEPTFVPPVPPINRLIHVAARPGRVRVEERPGTVVVPARARIIEVPPEAP